MKDPAKLTCEIQRNQNSFIIIKKIIDNPIEYYDETKRIFPDASRLIQQDDRMTALEKSKKFKNVSIRV